VQLGRHIGKNGSWHWVGAGRRDEMKNKIIKKIYRLITVNLTKRAKEIYKKVSNVQNLIFNQMQMNSIRDLILGHTSIQE
jgi:hypothetical protein